MADNQKKQTPARPAAKAKKPIGERIAKWFREIKSEIKKITWPSGKEVFNNTVVTLVLVVLLGAVIWVADFGLNSMRDFLLSKVPVSDTDKFDVNELNDFLAEYLASGSDVSPGDAVSAGEVTAFDAAAE
ncbi:MAG: preprotein translocase subunit SecE [Oscillospiraceae bacterium]|nr:preprotein translocase subunit SecE [Oscillospiraceae bacterium]